MNSQSNTTPAAVIHDSGSAAALNDDVLTEILLLLPAKYVTRFKLVCKRWLSLISADQFCRLYILRRPQSQPSLILSTANSRFCYFNPIIHGENQMLVPYTFNLPDIPIILSSCSGLMLLQCGNPKTDYYVYNPATKSSRRLSLTHSEKYINVSGLHLAFDPLKSRHYKIICVRATEKPSDKEGTVAPLARIRSHQIEVYDSVSHTWKVLLEPFTGPSQAMNFSFGVHCNNMIYGKTLHGSVYYIDIDKNVLRFLPPPKTPKTLPGGSSTCSSQSLFESHGYLYYSAVVSDCEGESVALWELQEKDGPSHSQWFLKYLDRIGHLLTAFGSLAYPIPLRYVSRSEGEEATSILVICVSGKIGGYSFLDKRYKELVDLKRHPFPLGLDLKLHSGDVHQFGETVALV